ncbi:MAG: hypothetical protein R3Y56_00695 [Akkermansia sp.]
MKVKTLLKTSHTWLMPEDDNKLILVATLGRLSRSLKGQIFPGWSTQESRQKVLDALRPTISSLPHFKTGFCAELSDLKHHERKLLQERKLISPSMAARGDGSEVYIPRKQNISIMLNEEEHLVIHTFAKGNAIDELRDKMETLASKLEKKLDFAKSAEGDYLTSIPAECGNGIQMYLVLHLPGLVISNLMKEVRTSLEQLNLQLTPFYGDGKEDTGDLFVMSHLPDTDIQCDLNLDRLVRVAKALVKRERQVRAKLLHLRPLELRDQITRALGRLLYATTLSFTEMTNAISLLILGTYYQILRWDDDEDEHPVAILRDMVLSHSPAHLAERVGLQSGGEDSRHMMALRALSVQLMLGAMNVSIIPINNTSSAN